MPCVDIQARVQELLDERQSPCDDPLVREHLSGCAACAHWVAALEAASSALGRPACPPDITKRVLAGLAATQNAIEPVSHSAGRWRLAASIVAAVAAALLLLASPWWGDFGQRQPPDEAAGFEELARNMTDSYRDLAQETSRRFSDALSLMRFQRAGEAPRSRPADDDAPWQRELANSFSPVAESAVGAVYSLWQVVPLPEEPRS